MAAAFVPAAGTRVVRGMRGVGAMTAVRTVGVVRRGRFRFGRHSFQGAFFFDFFGFFLFFGFVLFPCFPFLRFPPFSCFPAFLRFPLSFSLLPFLGALASFLPSFPFSFLDARRRDWCFRLRPTPAGADCGSNRDAQRHKKRPFGANLLELWRHRSYPIRTLGATGERPNRQRLHRLPASFDAAESVDFRLTPNEYPTPKSSLSPSANRAAPRSKRYRHDLYRGDRRLRGHRTGICRALGSLTAERRPPARPCREGTR